jgi:AraC-like DNA-binding protein
MSIKNCVTVDHSAFLPEGNVLQNSVQNESVSHTIKQDWGTLDLKTLFLPNAFVYYLKADLTKNVHIRHVDNNECSSVKSCFSLNGNVSSNFYGLKERLTLNKGTQNFMYNPVMCDDHYVDATVSPLQLLHLEVDTNYYSGLLNFNEKWSDDLKERISKKQLIVGCPEMMNITPRMHRALSEILNCSLSGPLRNLMLEAKILELIAYQLDQFRQFTTECGQLSFPKAEKDKFYDLKEYLDQSYNEDHSLKSLAKAYGVNEFKLKKGFKNLFGQTVFGYIHSLKMKQARMLIEDHGLNVSQVASRTGYKNANHFSVAFKKQFGLSPSAVLR